VPEASLASCTPCMAAGAVVVTAVRTTAWASRSKPLDFTDNAVDAHRHHPAQGGLLAHRVTMSTNWRATARGRRWRRPLEQDGAGGGIHGVVSEIEAAFDRLAHAVVRTRGHDTAPAAMAACRLASEARAPNTPPRWARAGDGDQGGAAVVGLHQRSLVQVELARAAAMGARISV